MTINLKYVLAISIFLSVFGYLIGIGSQLTDLGLSATQVKAVIAIFVILLGIGNSINSVLIAFGMSNASKMASASTLTPTNKLTIAADLGSVTQIDVNDKALADSVPSDKVKSM